MPSLSGRFSEVPPLLREVLKADPEERKVPSDWDTATATPQATAAIAYARHGYKVLPCLPSEKKPRTIGQFKHAARSATNNYERVVEHWLNFPDDNVGFAPDGRNLIVDVDTQHGGSLEAVEAIGLPVDGFRYRSVSGGWHIPLNMPEGSLAAKTHAPSKGIEIRGPGSYVVSPWSQVGGTWYRVEANRNIWRYGEVPASWSLLDKLIPSKDVASLEFTLDDEIEARELMDRMRRSTDYGVGIAALLENHPDWPIYFPLDSQGYRDESRSGRDIRIALIATHYLRDHPRRNHLVAALVYQLSEKARNRSNPGGYLNAVVRDAIAERERRDMDQVRSFLEEHVNPVKKVLFDEYFLIPDLSRRERTELLERTILRFSSVTTLDRFTRNDGWRLFPMKIVASAFQVSREAVYKRLVALESRDLIERRYFSYRHDGGVRRDSLIRVRMG